MLEIIFFSRYWQLVVHAHAVKVVALRVWSESFLAVHDNYLQYGTERGRFFSSFDGSRRVLIKTDYRKVPTLCNVFYMEHMMFQTATFLIWQKLGAAVFFVFFSFVCDKSRRVLINTDSKKGSTTVQCVLHGTHDVLSSVLFFPRITVWWSDCSLTIATPLLSVCWAWECRNVCFILSWCTVRL